MFCDATLKDNEDWNDVVNIEVFPKWNRNSVNSENLINH